LDILSPGYVSTQIKNSPAITREFFDEWRLDETTTPDNTWVVGAVISFSDYKSDYILWFCELFAQFLDFGLLT
jgi:hypothetical protein